MGCRCLGAAKRGGPPPPRLAPPRPGFWVGFWLAGLAGGDAFLKLAPPHLPERATCFAPTRRAWPSRRRGWLRGMLARAPPTQLNPGFGGSDRCLSVSEGCPAVVASRPHRGHPRRISAWDDSSRRIYCSTGTMGDSADGQRGARSRQPLLVICPCRVDPQRKKTSLVILNSWEIWDDDQAVFV